MGKITELVEAEAARAERDADADAPVDPDAPVDSDAPVAPDTPAEPDTPTEPTEPTEPPEPLAPPADEPSNADIVALEKELERHWTKVEEIMGEDFTLFAPCPMCEENGTPLYGLLPVGALANVPQYRRREDTEPCPQCDALGLMVTGSKVAGQELLPCTRCTGAGYVARAAVPLAAVATPAAAAAEPPEVAALRAQGFTVLAPYMPAS